MILKYIPDGEMQFWFWLGKAKISEWLSGHWTAVFKKFHDFTVSKIKTMWIAFFLKHSVWKIKGFCFEFNSVAFVNHTHLLLTHLFLRAFFLQNALSLSLACEEQRQHDEQQWKSALEVGLWNLKQSLCRTHEYLLRTSYPKY